MRTFDKQQGWCIQRMNMGIARIDLNQINNMSRCKMYSSGRMCMQCRHFHTASTGYSHSGSTHPHTNHSMWNLHKSHNYSHMGRTQNQIDSCQYCIGCSWWHWCMIRSWMGMLSMCHCRGSTHRRMLYILTMCNLYSYWHTACRRMQPDLRNSQMYSFYIAIHTLAMSMLCFR